MFWSFLALLVAALPPDRVAQPAGVSVGTPPPVVNSSINIAAASTLGAADATVPSRGYVPHGFAEHGRPFASVTARGILSQAQEQLTSKLQGARSSFVRNIAVLDGLLNDKGAASACSPVTKRRFGGKGTGKGVACSHRIMGGKGSSSTAINVASATKRGKGAVGKGVRTGRPSGRGKKASHPAKRGKGSKSPATQKKGPAPKVTSQGRKIVTTFEDMQKKLLRSKLLLANAT
eukprot:TRINITY_DN18414_c0_g1_i1.p1 TRINITY_DN18414_c0_g1~~TRINITY_DN18414_c0_g1_i1.p1  ORF type:complete len:233 (+),score=33.66 TRINITY_DN18414_c0_g1_i1:128-826(+)